MADRSLRTAIARERWERIGLGIRLAYNPHAPHVIRCWIALGARLAADCPMDEGVVLRRTLNLLVRVAEDEALPLAWRRNCLESCTRPLARLRTVSGLGCEARDAELESRMQAAEQRLYPMAGSRRPAADRLRAPYLR